MGKMELLGPGTQMTPVLMGKKPFCWKVLERPKNRGHLQVPGTYLWIHSLKLNEIKISHLGKFGKSSTQICQKSGGYMLIPWRVSPPKRPLWDSPRGISQRRLRAARFTRSKAARKASRKSWWRDMGPLQIAL